MYEKKKSRPDSWSAILKDGGHIEGRGYPVYTQGLGYLNL